MSNGDMWKRYGSIEAATGTFGELNEIWASICELPTRMSDATDSTGVSDFQFSDPANALVELKRVHAIAQSRPFAIRQNLQFDMYSWRIRWRIRFSDPLTYVPNDPRRRIRKTTLGDNYTRVEITALRQNTPDYDYTGDEASLHIATYILASAAGLARVFGKPHLETELCELAELIKSRADAVSKIKH